MLYVTAEVIRQVAILAQPFMPAVGGQAARPPGACRPTSARSARSAADSASRRARRCRRRRRCFRAMLSPRPARPHSLHAGRQPLPSRFSRLRGRARRRGGARPGGRRRPHGHHLDPGEAPRRGAGDRRALSRMSSARSARIRNSAHEELDITAADLVARTRHPKVVAIGEAGLDYHYDDSPRDVAGAGLPQHIAAARETGLPLVIHSRDADDDMARILEEETGKGAFPAVLHCFTGGPDLAAPRDRARALDLVHRHPDVQEVGRAARHRQGPAGRPHPGRDRRAVSRARAASAASATSRPTWSRPPRCWPRPAASAFDEIARQTTDNFFRLFSKVPGGYAAAVPRRRPKPHRPEPIRTA